MDETTDVTYLKPGASAWGKKSLSKKKSVTYRLVPAETGPEEFESDQPKYVFIPVSKGNEKLASETDKIFCSKKRVHTERVFPSKGPRPDWDPDVVAGLDDDFDYEDPDNVLDDEFVLRANAPGITNLPEREAEDQGKEDDDDDGSECSDISSRVFSEDYEDSCVSDNIKHSKRWRLANSSSQYSMTSATSNCTEDVKLMNEKFEKLLEVYEDDEIGAVEIEEIDSQSVGEDSPLYRVLNFENSNKEECIPDSCEYDIKDKVLKYATQDKEKFVTIFEEESDSEWDCTSYAESHVSKSYQPVVIRIEKLGKQRSRNTSITTDLEEETEDISDLKGDSLAYNGRPKDETPEERRERKQKVKAARKESREIKKNCKLAFKNEKKRQAVNQANNSVAIKLL